jgi:hypothetical protein
MIWPEVGLAYRELFARVARTRMRPDRVAVHAVNG